jgi:hypothetical protein
MTTFVVKTIHADFKGELTTQGDFAEDGSHDILSCARVGDDSSFGLGFPAFIFSCLEKISSSVKYVPPSLVSIFLELDESNLVTSCRILALSTAYSLLAVSSESHMSELKDIADDFDESTSCGDLMLNTDSNWGVDLIHSPWRASNPGVTIARDYRDDH